MVDAGLVGRPRRQLSARVQKGIKVVGRLLGHRVLGGGGACRACVRTVPAAPRSAAKHRALGMRRGVPMDRCARWGTSAGCVSAREGGLIWDTSAAQHRSEAKQQSRRVPGRSHAACEQQIATGTPTRADALIHTCTHTGSARTSRCVRVCPCVLLSPRRLSTHLAGPGECTPTFSLKACPAETYGVADRLTCGVISLDAPPNTACGASMPASQYTPLARRCTS